MMPSNRVQSRRSIKAQINAGRDKKKRKINEVHSDLTEARAEANEFQPNKTTVLVDMKHVTDLVGRLDHGVKSITSNVIKEINVVNNSTKENNAVSDKHKKELAFRIKLYTQEIKHTAIVCQEMCRKIDLMRTTLNETLNVLYGKTWKEATNIPSVGVNSTFITNPFVKKITGSKDDDR